MIMSPTMMNAVLASVTTSNTAPVGLSLENGWVNENSAAGTVIGAFTAFDKDNDTLTYELLNNAGGRFKLIGDKLVVAEGAGLDYETADSHTIKVRVSDGHGGTMEGEFFIEVNDVNETGKNLAPKAIMMEGPLGVKENAANGTLVTTLTCFDPENDAVTYKLIDNAGGAFRLVGDKLYVADGTKIDHEASKGWINVTVRATDIHGGFKDGTFSIYVGDMKEEVVYGSKGNNTLVGGAKNDKFFGGAGNDKLDGAAGNDKVSGDNGNDVITGGKGKDILSGGKGKDAFVFNAFGKKNVDKIADFSVKDDTIHLVQSVFKDAGPKGVLSSDAFWIGSAAHDADDRVIYNASTGALSYDVDGLGGQDAVIVAVLRKGLTTISHEDFLIV